MCTENVRRSMDERPTRKSKRSGEVLERPLRKRRKAGKVRSDLVDRAQTFQAVKALLKHVRKSQGATDTRVSVIFGTKKVTDLGGVKPIRISLVHPLYKPDASEICFIVKDPQRTMKDYLAENGSCGVTKVLGISKLKARYRSFEAKRELCSSFDLFLADDRVLPLLPKLLGKVFFRSKKIPAAVNMRRNVKEELEAAIGSSYLSPSSGTCSAVVAGTVSLKSKKLTDNIMVVVDQVAAKLPGGASVIQSIHIKTSESVALPIYNSLPRTADYSAEDGDEEPRSEAEAGDNDNDGGDDDDGDDEDVQ